MLTTNLILGLVLGMDLVYGPPMPDAQVKQAIETLGSKVFRERLAAHERLERMGWRAIRGVEIEMWTSQDPEVALRCRRIAEQYYSVRPSDNKELPSIMMLPEQFEYRGKKYCFGIEYLKHYGRIACGTQWELRQLPYDSELPHWATGHLVRDLLRQGWEREAVIALLDAMQVGQPRDVREDSDFQWYGS